MGEIHDTPQDLEQDCHQTGDNAARLAEDQARSELEDAYSSFFENNHAVMLLIDPDSGAIVDANPAAECFYGWSRDSLKHKNISEINTLTPEEIRREMQRARAARRNHFLFQHRRADGSVRDVEVYSGAIRTRRKELLYSIVHDITERKHAEEALVRAHERLQCIIDGTRAGTWEWNVQTGETVFNETWARMLGYTLDELSPYTVKTWERLLHPDDVEMAKDRLAGCIEGKQPDYECEFRMKHKRGHWVWILDRGRLLTRDAGGNPLMMFGTHIDITQRKQAEEALSQREHYFRTILQTTADGFWVFDIQGRVVDANSAYCAMTGYSRDEMLGLHINDVYADEDPAETAARIRRIIKNGSELSEARHVRKDGGTFPVETTISYLDEEGGKFVCFCRDLTERKRTEDALLLTQFAVDRAADGILWIDEEGNLVYGNDATCASMGYTRDEVLRMKVFDIDPDFPIEGWQRHMEELRRRKTLKFESRHRTKDGRTFPVEITTNYIEFKGRFFTCVFDRDITQRKQAEEERARLHDQLTQAQKMESIGRLAGGVAHDFNNMLNVILGHAELLLDDLAAGNPLRADIEEILKAAQRSADLTRQLLAFARRQTVEPRILNLNETVASMLKMLRRLIGEDIRLVWKPADALDPVYIDPAQIDQILANLVVNARDAIDGVGRITIEMGQAEFDENFCATNAGFIPGRYVMLAVSDDGRGMDEETKARVFEPFFTTKGVGEGTGLGLATVYGVVKQNEGFILVRSELGRGSTFRIYLPARVAHEMAGDTDAADTRAPALGHEDILLVEDEPAILSLSTTMLERLGYRVIAASTPAQAIRLASQHAGEIHLLITDVVMPDMNGLDLADRLRSRYPNLKCIFMSGYTADIIAEQGVIDEGVNFIQKPFSMRRFGEKVRETLDH